MALPIVDGGIPWNGGDKLSVATISARIILNYNEEERIRIAQSILLPTPTYEVIRHPSKAAMERLTELVRTRSIDLSDKDAMERVLREEDI